MSASSSHRNASCIKGWLAGQEVSEWVKCLSSCALRDSFSINTMATSTSRNETGLFTKSLDCALLCFLKILSLRSLADQISLPLTMNGTQTRGKEPRKHGTF